jgi:hypothetical protein
MSFTCVFHNIVYYKTSEGSISGDLNVIYVDEFIQLG